MFFNWIYRRSNIQILIILVMFFVVLLDVMPRILQSIPFFSPTEDSTRLGLSLFGSIITLSGLLIGFLLNQAQTNFREVQSLVSREAGQINNLDRLLVRYGDPSIVIMRKELFEYMNSIVNDEWNFLKEGQGSPKTHMLWRGISRKLLSLEPQTIDKQLCIPTFLKRQRRLLKAGSQE